jgi:hypothetical protein
MARGADKYKRKSPIREPFETVLIVCEGEKTEPRYFNGLRMAYGLTSVVVTSARGSDPLSVVDHALDRMAKEDFDRAFAVFDRDSHANCNAAISKVADSDLGRSNIFKAVVTEPCFEFWLLLHYGFTSAAFTRMGSNSPCDQVIRALRSHDPDYAKGGADIYSKVAARTNDAITHARRLAAENAQTGSRNPATDVHELVEHLINLRKTDGS